MRGDADREKLEKFMDALGKLERGHERDALDVWALVEQGLVDRKKLKDFFEQIRPMLKRFPAIDVASFAESVRGFCAQA